MRPKLMSLCRMRLFAVSVILHALFLVFVLMIGYHPVLQGRDPSGIPAYIHIPETGHKRNTAHGIYTGKQWECVEFVRRWLILKKGVTFDDVKTAADVWKLDHVTQISDKTQRPFTSVTDKDQSPPVGAVLVFRPSKKNEHKGHVAVVVRVMGDDVDIAEQNWDHRRWDSDKSRTIRIKTEPDLMGWKMA